jgi:pyruvate/2-oxoglutarate dehydrogenase complex dihydrolipoamide acyltransferase (E2) component
MTDEKPDASKVSVRAQQAAEEHGIDLSKVSGSGDKGRIRLADVEKHVSTQTDE